MSSAAGVVVSGESALGIADGAMLGAAAVRGVITCTSLPGRLPVAATRTRIGVPAAICADTFSGVARWFPFAKVVRGAAFHVSPLSIENSCVNLVGSVSAL